MPNKPKLTKEDLEIRLGILYHEKDGLDKALTTIYEGDGSAYICISKYDSRTFQLEEHLLRQAIELVLRQVQDCIEDVKFNLIEVYTKGRV